jgi:hypothetical protein
MKIRTALLIAALFLISGIANAQQQPYQPEVGQEGKDVIWVPTPNELVSAMLDLAEVTSDDVLMDLGSGDGRIVIAAAKRGVHATGIEYNPDMVALSKRNAESAGVSEKATFVNADLFATDLSKATVITMYLLPQLNLKLRPTILGLKPGTRVASHAFNMGDWQYDQTVERDGRTAYLWIVPAKVDGTWIWASGGKTMELRLTQNYQMVEGTLKIDEKTQAIKNGRLVGKSISFICGNEEFSGQVDGRSIAGRVKANGSEQKWSASKN